MATELESLLVRIDASTEGLRREMRRAGQATESFDRRSSRAIQNQERRWRNFQRTVASLGLAAVFTRMAQGARQAVDELGQLADTADKLGLTVEALQELRFAANEVGVNTQTADLAFQRFIRRLGEAQKGSGELKATLEDLGIDFSRGRQSIDVLRDMADAIRNAESQQERLAIAFKAFDSEGAALVNLMQRGSGAIDEFAAEARELGLVLSQETVEAGRIVDRQFEILTQKMATTWKQRVVELADAFGVLEDRALTLAAELNKLNNMAPQRRLALNPREIQKYEDLGVIIQDLLTAEGGVRFIDPTALRQRLQATRDLLNLTVTGDRSIPTPGVGGTTGLSTGLSIKPKDKPNSLEFFEARREEQQAAAKEIEDTINSLTVDYLRSTDQQIAAVRELSKIEIARLENLKDQFPELADEYDRAIELVEKNTSATVTNIEKSLDEAGKAAEAFGNTLNQQMQQAILNGERLDKVLGRLLLNAALFGVDGKGGLFGGFLSDLTSNIATAFDFGGGVDGKKAAGGPVSAGKLYQVNERGMELFAPSTSGRVIPLGEQASNANGDNVTVQIINNTGAQTKTQRTKGANGEDLVRVMIGEVSRDIRNNGQAGQTISQVFGLTRAGR